MKIKSVRSVLLTSLLLASNLSQVPVWAKPMAPRVVPAANLDLNTQFDCTRDCQVAVRQRGRLVLSTAGTQLSAVPPDHFRIFTGKIMVTSKEPIRISAPLGEVAVRNEAMVLIESDETCLRVTNLFDLDNESVRVVSTGKKGVIDWSKNAGNQSPDLQQCVALPVQVVSPRAGVEVIVTEGMPEPQDVFSNCRVGHRSLNSTELQDGGWITTSEVSIVNLLAADCLLRAMRRASGKTQEAKLIQKILKTAAILKVVLKGRESFQKITLSDDSSGQRAHSPHNSVQAEASLSVPVR